MVTVPAIEQFHPVLGPEHEQAVLFFAQLLALALDFFSRCHTVVHEREVAPVGVETEPISFFASTVVALEAVAKVIDGVFMARDRMSVAPSIAPRLLG